MKSALVYASASLLLTAPAALAEPPPATTGPVDGLVSAPENFKLLLENDQVRVLQYMLLPGARDHWHTHPPRVGYILSGAKIRVTEAADGLHQDYDEKTGETYWGEFSPLHDTMNIGATPYIALLVEVKASPSTSTSSDEAAIRSQRATFNRALAEGNTKGIAAILADDAQLVTGADSMIVAGKAAQLALWAEDLTGPKRRSYNRKPLRILLSSVGPMALETGEWRGFQMSEKGNWAAGDYVAKWRRIDGAWKIESETYMATDCGGTFCPTRH